MHALPTVYNRRIDNTIAEKLEPGIAQIVAKDLDWLEDELERGGGRFLVGDTVTAADTMMAFTVQFIFAKGLGPKDRRWEKVNGWLRNVEGVEAYQRAVAKTGHRFD